MKVLITSEFFGKFSSEGKKVLLDANLEVIDNPYGHKFLSRSEIIPHIAHADAIICDLESIDKTVIDAGPSLKIIARRGVGTDSVDVEYAQSKGIQVARTLDVVEAPVAELVMGYILELSRNICRMNISMKNGVWEKLHSNSLAGKTLGIFGLGKIGMKVCTLAKAFDMKIIYCDTQPNEKAETEFGAVKVDMNDLLADGDFISLHAPLTEETRHVINGQSLKRMKKTAYLINTARGALVDQDALLAAVKAKEIAGAALDVYPEEPCDASIWNGLDSVITTPHIATFTEEVFVRMDILAAQNVVANLLGK